MTTLSLHCDELQIQSMKLVLIHFLLEPGLVQVEEAQNLFPRLHVELVAKLWHWQVQQRILLSCGFGGPATDTRNKTLQISPTSTRNQNKTN